MKSKIAIRAWTWVLNRRRSSSSHSRVAKKLSHMALSKQSPTEPIEGRTPASRQRWRKAMEVYCCHENLLVQGSVRTSERLQPRVCRDYQCLYDEFGGFKGVSRRAAYVIDREGTI